MIRHVVKLMWHRKGANLLVMVEVLIAFLTLCAVATVGVLYADNYRRPLGYSIDDAWSVGMEARSEAEPVPTDEIVGHLARDVRDLPEVETVAAAFTAPYAGAQWTTSITVGGRELDYDVNRATDEYARVFGISLIRGRWFSREDDGAPWTPVVVNERFAQDVLGTVDAVGRSLPRTHDKDGRLPDEQRVVGVMTDFRQNGEFTSPTRYLFSRMRLSSEPATEGTTPSESAGHGPEAGPPRLLLIKVRPGTTAMFEEKLSRTLARVSPEWSFDIEPVAHQRERWLRNFIAPLVVIALVGGFLMCMVALGLTGVLWQDVTRRTREIGLRRAKGATAGQIHVQILGEIVVMTTFAVTAGVLLAIQVPMLNLVTWISPRVFVLGIALSAGAIYVLTIACGWYPSRLATGLSPAEALHYE